MQSNRNIFIVIIIGVMIIAASILYVNRPSNIDVQDQDGSAPTDDKPEPTPESAKSKVKKIIKEYLSEIGSQIPEAETENIEIAVKDYQIELQPASEAITVLAKVEEEIEYTLDIKTRDWAYAAFGIENTLIGGLVDEQEAKLDLGLYSFLQAAALNLDEPEHLSNVAFHLNNKGDYENAKTILRYALTIDESYFPALSNLAYAYAGQGDYTKAILEQLKVVSLRPEKWYLLRLADYYEKAGLPEASEVILSAIEGSQTESIPSLHPSITLSSNGEAVMDEVEKLDESLYAKCQAIIDSKRPPLLDLINKLMNEWVVIAERGLYECPMNVFSSGGDSHDVCVKCYVPAANEAFNLVSTARANALPLIHSFESEAFKELEKYTRQAVEIVEDADLDESERESLLKEVHRRFTVEYTIRIMGPRQSVQSTCAQIQSEYSAAMAEGCGDVSMEIPKLDEEDWECKNFPTLCKKWKFWFIIGSISYDPKGDFELSLGQGLAFKYKYNFARDISNIGVGYGINLDKIILAGATLYFNPTEGVQGELSAGFAPPLPMLIVDLPTSVKTSKPLFGSFMN